MPKRKIINFPNLAIYGQYANTYGSTVVNSTFIFSKYGNLGFFRKKTFAQLATQCLPHFFLLLANKILQHKKNP
jgi:hypothetical protein